MDWRALRNTLCVIAAVVALSVLAGCYAPGYGPGAMSNGPIERDDIADVADVAVDSMPIRYLPPVDQVERIEYLSPGDATTRFGTGHVDGVILITTR